MLEKKHSSAPTQYRLKNLLSRKILFPLQAKLILFSVYILCSASLPLSADISQKTVFFYSEKLTVKYNPNMVIDLRVVPKEYNETNRKGTIQNFFEMIEKSDYQILLDDLTKYKSQYGLNDWFFYELIRNSIDQIYLDRPTLHKRLAIWSILVKAGYDIRVTYLDGEVFLNAYTTEEIYEVPLIVENEKTFINLTSIHIEEKPAETLFIANFVPNPLGKPFSFDIENLPKLRPQATDRQIQFEDRSAKYSFNISFDRTIVELMKNYPFITEDQYVQTSFSPTLSKSILPVMRDILEGKSNKEALEILVAFTRSGFSYKTDEEVYGKSKPMIPEELFHYHFSDCEDRSALFFNLVKELLGLPMIVIAYHDHVTVGVGSEEVLGDYLFYKGKRYYLCDPTGPSNSYEIGIFPEGYSEQNFEVIASF